MYFVPLGIVGVPPSIFAIHSQLNFAFGTSSHCRIFPKMHKIVPGLGHLVEFIFVTPSHHRVHHGVNKYCLDKNYGMYLIIWDRMFGTFVEEREDEPITYGTVSQLETFDVMNIQVKPFLQLYRKMQTMKTTGDKLRALFYGPNWYPGKPRLGDDNDIPDVRGRKKLELFLPPWLNVYLACHVLLILFMVLDTGVRVQTFGPWLCMANFFIILSGCTSLGSIFDANYCAVWLESFRLVFLLVICNLYPIFSSYMITNFVSAHCLCSLLFWSMLRNYIHSSHGNTGSGINGVKMQKTN